VANQAALLPERFTLQLAQRRCCQPYILAALGHG
jgi:hypothetical protein